MDHILGLDIPLPALLISQRIAVGIPAHVDGVRVGVVRVPALGIAGHETQAGDAKGFHVQVVADLPGLLLRRVEVAVLDGVVQVDRIGMPQVIEVIVTVVALISHDDAVGAELHPGLAAPDVVVEAAEQLFALIDGFVVVEATDQRHIIGQCIAQRGAEVILVPGILEATGVEADGNVVIY
ncbi:hypothetical protein D9M70_536860 [compost metagenome]